mmetsp:Transcript_21710/g.47688  ORF Transcript_21710/g.47688 Transcript_21710/m.47688 type:complete len:212 (+) Transcript_21710:221-856(+)
MRTEPFLARFSVLNVFFLPPFSACKVLFPTPPALLARDCRCGVALTDRFVALIAGLRTERLSPPWLLSGSVLSTLFVRPSSLLIEAFRASFRVLTELFPAPSSTAIELFLALFSVSNAIRRFSTTKLNTSSSCSRATVSALAMMSCVYCRRLLVLLVTASSFCMLSTFISTIDSGVLTCINGRLGELGHSTATSTIAGLTGAVSLTSVRTG